MQDEQFLVPMANLILCFELKFSIFCGYIWVKNRLCTFKICSPERSIIYIIDLYYYCFYYYFRRRRRRRRRRCCYYYYSSLKISTIANNRTTVNLQLYIIYNNY